MSLLELQSTHSQVRVGFLRELSGDLLLIYTWSACSCINSARARVRGDQVRSLAAQRVRLPYR